MPDPTSNPPSQHRGWSLVAAGFLLLALAVVVLYTSRSAFSSPLAIVVVAAIGLAALLLQLRLRADLRSNQLRAPVRAPLGLNILGVLFAFATIFPNALHLSPRGLFFAALGAVTCFAVSGIIVLKLLRKK